jgi:hypothetical protein
MLALLDSRLSGVRTEAGEPIVDLVDSVAVEQYYANVQIEYLRRINSVAGWQALVVDTTFQTDLAEALGLSMTSLDPTLARTLSVPPTITTDLDAVLWADLTKFADSAGRPRKDATYASGTLRVYLPNNNPVVLLRGAVVRSNRSKLLYETITDLVGVTPGLDLDSNKYYVDVAIQCRQAGILGNASRGTVNTISSGFGSISAVTNLTALEGGADAETNEALLTALAAGGGADVNTANGLRNFIMSQAGVIDALVTGSGSSLMTRAAGGAVDVWAVGATLRTISSIVRVLVEGETVVLPIQPVRTISSVTAGSPLSEGNSFVSVLDTGEYAGSTKARTSITWKSVATGGPAAGTDVTVTYTYNDLVRDLQRSLDDDPDRNVPSSDILVREATRASIFVELRVVPYPGVPQATAEDAVSQAISDLIDNKLLGQDLDYSDVLIAAGEAEIDNVKAIDRIDDLRIGKTETAISTSNLVIADNQYARLEQIVFLAP